MSLRPQERAKISMTKPTFAVVSLDCLKNLVLLAWTAPLLAAGNNKPTPEYAWELVTAKAAVCPARRGGGADLPGPHVVPRRLEPRRQEALPAHLQQRSLEFRRRQGLAARQANTFLDKTFDPAKDWEGRHTAGYVVHQNKMWIVGGDVNQGHYQFDVWNSADGKTWTHVNKGKPVPWGPRALHYTLAFKDKIWVIGGQTIPMFAKDKEIFYRDVWNSADGVNWTEVKPKEPFWPQRGMIGGSAVFKDRIWILGGGTYDTPKIPDTQVLQRRLELRRRRHLAAACRSRSLGAAAIPRRRRLRRPAVGHGGLPQGQPQRRLALRRRRQLARSAQDALGPRHAASVYVHDGALWMVAGNNMESDVWKLKQKR